MGYKTPAFKDRIMHSYDASWLRARALSGQWIHWQGFYFSTNLGADCLLRSCASLRVSFDAADACARLLPNCTAALISSSNAPRSCSGAANSESAALRPIIQSAVAYKPMPTPASPASMRMSVGTEVPIRAAHEAKDSLRRSRATAKSAPSLRRPAAAAGGI